MIIKLLSKKKKIGTLEEEAVKTPFLCIIKLLLWFWFLVVALWFTSHIFTSINLVIDLELLYLL